MTAALTCSILSLISCRILCFLVSGVFRRLFLLGRFLGFTSTVKNQQTKATQQPPPSLNYCTYTKMERKTSEKQLFDIPFCGWLPSDSVDAPAFRRQKMEVVEACRGRNFSRRRGLSLMLILSPVIFFLSTFLFIFLKKSGISTSLLSHSPWHCVKTQRES